MEKLFTVKGLSEWLNISEKTIYKLLKKGLPCYRLGSSIRFDPQIVLSWLIEAQAIGQFGFRPSKKRKSHTKDSL